MIITASKDGIVKRKEDNTETKASKKEKKQQLLITILLQWNLCSNHYQMGITCCTNWQSWHPNPLHVREKY